MSSRRFGCNLEDAMRIRASRTLLGIVVVIIVVLDVSFTAEQAPAGNPNLARLKSRIEEAIPLAQGVVGVSIKHLESNTSLDVNGDGVFPMASTFKLPVLVELHALAKAGGRAMGRDGGDFLPHQHLGSGDLTPLYDPPGVALSMRNLANLMMMISDNSAADICLAKAGAAKVTARMRSLGIDGIRVDRSCQELILDYGGRDTAKLKDLARDDLREALRRDPAPRRSRRASPRTTASPPIPATPRRRTPW